MWKLFTQRPAKGESTKGLDPNAEKIAKGILKRQLCVAGWLGARTQGLSNRAKIWGLVIFLVSGIATCCHLIFSKTQSRQLYSISSTEFIPPLIKFDTGCLPAPRENHRKKQLQGVRNLMDNLEKMAGSRDKADSILKANPVLVDSIRGVLLHNKK